MNIEEIELRWNEASPGPWKRVGISGQFINDINGSSVMDGEEWPMSENNVRAVVAAPQDIAFLLDRVRDLECELSVLQSKIDCAKGALI